MSSVTVLALAAGVPIITVFILMAGLRWSALRSMGVGWLLASALGLLLWRMEPVWLAASAAYGALQAFEIILIIFGAILLMNHLKASGGLETMRWHITHIVEDQRAQVLLVGLGFMTLMEGVAGFGTPGVLAAPLLIGLGLPPLAAVFFGLMFNAAQPPFGAAGTPVIGGIGAVIDEGVLGGSVTTEAFLENVSGWTAVVTGSAFVFWGLLAVLLLLYWFGREDERSLRGALRGVRPVVPFALLLGTVAGGVQFLVGWFFGPELPDIAAGLTVLAIGALAARRGWLLPEETWTVPSRDRWPEKWHGGLDVRSFAEEAAEKRMGPLLAWTPYLLVALVLLVTRWPGLGIVESLQSYSVDVPRILGQDLSFSLRPLYLPGVVPFIPVVLLTILIHGMGLRNTLEAWRESFRQVVPPAVTLIVAVSMAQIMIQSATNLTDRPGMMQALSTVLALGAGAAMPLVSPWIGTLGAFMTGSNTSSNVLFAVVQHDAAAATGVSRTVMVAMQNVGGGIGNMVSVLNIAAISGVVGMTGQEGTILRRMLVPTVVLAIFAGAVGMALTLLVGGLY